MSGRIRRAVRLATAMGIAAMLGGSAWGQAPADSEPMLMFDASMRPVVIDPLAAQMLRGTAMPMTRAEAGLSAAGSVQRMTGIGSGRISGVRGAAGPKGGAQPRAATTLRAPGGQASIYFNRFGGGTATDAAAPASRATTKNFYNRPAGFFPAGVR